WRDFAAKLRGTRGVCRSSNRPYSRPKYLALRAVYSAHFSGRSSKAKIAETGHTGTQAPQSIHSTGSIYSCVTGAKSSSFLRGWMQSTGHASTHAVSFTLIQGSAMTYAMVLLLSLRAGPRKDSDLSHCLSGHSSLETVSRKTWDTRIISNRSTNRLPSVPMRARSSESV